MPESSTVSSKKLYKVVVESDMVVAFNGDPDFSDNGRHIIEAALKGLVQENEGGSVNFTIQPIESEEDIPAEWAHHCFPWSHHSQDCRQVSLREIINGTDPFKLLKAPSLCSECGQEVENED